MFIQGKHLSRRSVLRGLGAAVSLPLLDAMVPSLNPIVAAAVTTKAKTRFAAIEIVHGAAGSTMDGTNKHYWSPAKEGADFEITPSLEPLKDLRKYLTVVTGTDLKAAGSFAPSEEGGDHFRSSAAYLTAAHPKMTEGSDISAGISIDQLYAKRFGQGTPLESLQLCIEDVDATGACAYGYACVYSDTISWASPTQPLPMLRDPRVAFERLFGDGATAEERAARRSLDQSILDGIVGDVKRLNGTLAGPDKARLEEYLTDVRGLETRIQNIERYNATAREAGANAQLPTAPVGIPENYDEHVKLMFDLQVLAFAADVTRVSAFKLSRDVSQRVFPGVGVSTPFHSASHHGESPAKIAEFAKVNRYHVSLLAYFLDKLEKTPDGDGNLLEHSAILYGSPMGDSNVHNHKRVPMLVAGHANGAIKGNFHLKTAEETPTANLYLTLMRRLGMDLPSIGDSTGELAI
ncbi:DUF1552 domain-containing protein [Acidicapsa ligni]|uniref:DUF1552 domain-containing protein n=1 Tax=Acidicapsa ligni TaxID=542300 RepID=UPI0021DF7459|nr:DUF1552 domain-containing protein [Acidicapsa ligni]